MSTITKSNCSLSSSEEGAEAALREEADGLPIALPGGEDLQVLDGGGRDRISALDFAPEHFAQPRADGQVEEPVDRGAAKVGVDQQGPQAAPARLVARWLASEVFPSPPTALVIITTRCDPVRAACTSMVRVASIDSSRRFCQ